MPVLSSRASDRATDDQTNPADRWNGCRFLIPRRHGFAFNLLNSLLRRISDTGHLQCPFQRGYRGGGIWTDVAQRLGHAAQHEYDLFIGVQQMIRQITDGRLRRRAEIAQCIRGQCPYVGAESLRALANDGIASTAVGPMARNAIAAKLRTRGSGSARERPSAETAGAALAAICESAQAAAMRTSGSGFPSAFATSLTAGPASPPKAPMARNNAGAIRFGCTIFAEVSL